MLGTTPGELCEGLVPPNLLRSEPGGPPRQDATMEVVQSSRGLERAPGPGRAGLLRALRQVLEVAVLGVAPIVVTAVVLGLAIGDDAAFDFRQFWQGGRDV